MGRYARLSCCQQLEQNPFDDLCFNALRLKVLDPAYHIGLSGRYTVRDDVPLAAIFSAFPETGASESGIGVLMFLHGFSIAIQDKD